ncbi:hypothetical protein [Emticicia sp. TH156]|uniref:hypothetical protein n=1 Tax=Emticicia sp. TH156 TaxID=2067454 RepID=UPI000C7795C6|nr:hypothetical protein [Emticicia sp. TH156]
MKTFLLNTFLFFCGLLPCCCQGSQKDTSIVQTFRQAVVGLNVSTLGAGTNLSVMIPSKVVLLAELGFSYFRFTRELNLKLPEGSSVFFQPDIHRNVVTGMLSWYPFKKEKFFLRAGLGYCVRQKYFVRVTSPTGLLLGGVEIASEDFGQVDLDIKWSNLMPYAGIGFGKPIPKKKLGVNFNIGCFYMGSPKINAGFQGFLESTTLDSQIALIEKNVRNYSYFPMLSVSLRYRLN